MTKTDLKKVVEGRQALGRAKAIRRKAEKEEEKQKARKEKKLDALEAETATELVNLVIVCDKTPVQEEVARKKEEEGRRSGRGFNLFGKGSS